MDAKKSHVTLVLDRSGSMSSCKTDTEGGVNEFINEQKNQEGEVSVSILEFDTELDYVCENIPAKEVGKYTLEPRGMTALLDAIGKAVNDTGKYLAGLPEEQRPALVTIMIVTDGHENSSREFNTKTIKDMIEHQQEKYNWQFSYLGANQDAFLVGGQLGFNAGDIANYDVGKSASAFKGMAGKFGRMHTASVHAKDEKERASVLRTVSAYTDEERSEMS